MDKPLEHYWGIRLAELKTELDPARLEQEIVILAQKMDVDE